jgi:predicted lipid-binding transport protein (Tim44 family)
MSPLSRVLAAVLGLLAVVGAFFFGLFILAVALGVGTLAWIAISLRAWWLRRQFAGQRGAEVIEAEYTVISKKESSD